MSDELYNLALEIAVYMVVCQHKYRLDDIVPQLGTPTRTESSLYNCVLFPGNIDICMNFLSLASNIIYWKSFSK